MRKLISKYFDVDGKIGRKQFFLRIIPLYLLVGVFAFINGTMAEVLIDISKNDTYFDINWLYAYSVFMMLCLFLIIISYITLEIRRVNDLNKPKWLLNLNFIPPIGIILLVYLIFAKNKSSKNALKRYVEVTSGEQINVEETKVIKESITMGNKLKRVLSRKLIVVVTVLLTVLIIVYFSFFNLPHNGEWSSEIYSHRFVLEIKNGEGRIRIYPKGTSKSAINSFYVLVYEKNKNNTTIGIDGRTHNIKTNGSVLVLELNDLDTKIGVLDNDLYFTK